MTDGRTDGLADSLLRRVAGLLALVATTAATLTAQAPERVTVIRNATIVPVVGDRIPNGAVVIRGGRIDGVGRDLPAPPGATVVDGTGLFVYPGLIDSGTELGLTEIGSVPGGTDTRELGDLNPHDLALSAVNPHSELIPVTRVNGITSVVTAAGGGLVSGYAALIDLAGWTPQEMGVLPRAAMVITYPRVAGGRFGGGGRGQQSQGADAAGQVNRQVEQLTQFLRNAKAYAERMTRAEAAGSRLDRVDLVLEAMVPVIQGKVPVIFDVRTVEQIRGALALADSFALKPIIRGGAEAWQLADDLAARKVPVIVGPTTVAPTDNDPYDMVYANPGMLAKAGVQIAFQTAGAADSRNLPYNVALSVAYGLDPEEALRAVTINPARIWGVADQLGSIERGKVANLIVTTGDPLDVRTQIRHVFVRGVEQPMNDRHTRLYEQFKARPKP
ncbi:MAG TPA: amidohydrolase family protein [Gemmatimonadales bacterium]